MVVVVGIVVVVVGDRVVSIGDVVGGGGDGGGVVLVCVVVGKIVFVLMFVFCFKTSSHLGLFKDGINGDRVRTL